MIRIKRFTCNMLQENCYVASCDITNECVVVDCGAYYEEERKSLLAYIHDNHLKPVHLLCTHGHVDHNFGNNTIFDEFGLNPEVHADDMALMDNLAQQSVKFIGDAPKYAFPPVKQYLSFPCSVGYSCCCSS